MTREVEQRIGRSKFLTRPRGGNVSPDPFPQALYKLASSRGYETQTSFARALGKKTNARVSSWYRTGGTPTPDQLGRILVLLAPNDEELNELIEPYGKLLKEGRAVRGGLPGTERAKKTGLKIMRSETLFDQWLQRFCEDRKLSITAVAKLLGFPHSDLSRRYRFGLQMYSEILQNAPEKLGLSKEETENLVEAVIQAIQQKLAKGHRFQENNSATVNRLQADMPSKTYNGEQAAQKLGVSREWIRQLREKHHLPLILTGDQVEMLREKIRKGR